MIVGDLVEAVAPFVLRSGCGWYENAVVVHVDPLILVSTYGDMRWSATITEESVKVVGKANKKDFKCAMKRFENDLKHEPSLVKKKNVV